LSVARDPLPSVVATIPNRHLGPRMSKVCSQCGAIYDDQAIFCGADGATLRPAEDHGDLLNTVIGDRYLVTAVLGQGGMGRVYLGKHVRMPLQVAIKVLRADLLTDAESLTRFNREARNACNIASDNVARVFDVGETNEGLPYLVMEYVPGRTLASLLEHEPLDPLRTAALVTQVARGLDAAHKLGILHRDIKPENILILARDDGTETAKVVDFGISKALNRETRTVTRVGFTLGTIPYMSPEQVVGGPIDARSDVYSLGLVTVEMLTGLLPFSGATAEELLTARLYRRPASLGDLRSGTAWPDALEEVIERVLAREEAERYDTAGAFASALAAAIEPWMRPAPIMKSRRRVLAVRAPRAVLTAGVVAVGALIAIAAPRRAEQPAPARPSAGAKSSSAPRGDSTVLLARGSLGPALQRTQPNVVASRPVATAPRGSTSSPTRSESVGSSEAPRVVSAKERLGQATASLAPGTITPELARSALASLTDLLPRLATRGDSLKAQLGQAKAFYFLGQTEKACDTLRRVRVEPKSEMEELLQLQRDALNCPAP
jgi:serine/threonine-protein kinase